MDDSYLVQASFYVILILISVCFSAVMVEIIIGNHDLIGGLAFGVTVMLGWLIGRCIKCIGFLWREGRI